MKTDIFLIQTLSWLKKIRALGTFSSNLNGDVVQRYETGPPLAAPFEESFKVLVPPVFASFGLTAWVPTIELSVNVRKIPDTLILKAIFKSRFISSGLVEEDGELWDTTGELVAISRQISKYRKRK